MKILIPMAGRGSRFANQGVETPKPLISVAGRPMVDWALQSVKDIPHSQLIFIALEEHETEYGVTELLNALGGSTAKVILIPEVTEGQLCTVLTARTLIDSDEDVLIASSDTYVRSSLARDIDEKRPTCRGIISVANLPGDRWSFARTDQDGRVVEVAEKVRISDYASTGLYYFSSGREFIHIADEMIANREKIRGEYYVIPVYQKYIDRGWRVEVSVADEMWDMGTPKAKKEFEQYLSYEETQDI